MPMLQIILLLSMLHQRGIAKHVDAAMATPMRHRAVRVNYNTCACPPQDAYGNCQIITHQYFTDGSTLTIFHRYIYCDWFEDEGVITLCPSPDTPCGSRSECFKDSYQGCGECWPEWGGCVTPSIGPH